MASFTDDCRYEIPAQHMIAEGEPAPFGHLIVRVPEAPRIGRYTRMTRTPGISSKSASCV
jgi:hypothetical protein